MKRVIEGKVYNTETATYIGDLPCSANPGDFQHHDTGLYRSPKGTYFLAGKGGPMSMWSESEGNSGRTGGSGIMTIPDDEARSYAESMDLDEDGMRAAGFEVEEG